MITYCSKCGINWASLYTDEVDSECYEFCPVCKTDMHLEKGNDIVSYCKCQITGRVYNVETNETLIWRKPRIRVVVGKKKLVYDETYEEYELRKDQEEDAAIDNYTGGITKTIEYPRVKRKYHLE